MSEPSNSGANLLDPFGFWKTARDSNLEAWSKLMIDIVNSDEYARATGTMLEQSLATSQPFRDAVEKSMTQSLAILNMPSRAEVVSIAERLVNVEMRLDDLDAKLTTFQRSLQESMKDTVRQALVTPGRDLKDIGTRLEQMDARFDALQEMMKVAVRQAMQTPGRHIKEIEAHVQELDTKLSAPPVLVEPEKPSEPGTAPARQPLAQTRLTAKKVQEGK
jgi:hypothetical protein